MELQRRDYQDRVVFKTLMHFENGVNSILIESPVGAGKTIMALRIVKALEDRWGIETNWCAMRRTLLQQAQEANDRWFGCKKIRFVSLFEKQPPGADLLVQDEGHHAACSTAVHFDTQCRARYVLGLSATPFRTDKLSLSFQKTVRDAGIHRLIQEGYLSQFHHWAIPEWSPKNVSEVYLTEREKWGSSVVFFQTIRECRHFQLHCALGGVRCEVITGQSDRERQIAEFEERRYPVIANVAILTEGFDSPRLQSVFVRDSSRLPTIQMAGRGLRTHPEKTLCNIIQSRNTRWPFHRTATPAASHVLKDKRWLSLENSERVEETAEEMTRRLIEVETEIPEWLQKKHRKTRIRA